MLKTTTVLGAALLLATSLSVVAGRDLSTSECTFRVTTGPFVIADHRLSYYKGGTTVMKIDGHDFSGTDGEVPRIEIRAISAQIGAMTYDLPLKAISGIFDPQIDCPTGCVLTCTPRASLRLTGGDGAGAYTVQWVVSTDATPAVLRHIWEQPDPEKPKERRFRIEVRR